jgi:hypothetical protein
MKLIPVSENVWICPQHFPHACFSFTNPLTLDIVCRPTKPDAEDRVRFFVHRKFQPTCCRVIVGVHVPLAALPDGATARDILLTNLRLTGRMSKMRICDVRREVALGVRCYRYEKTQKPYLRKALDIPRAPG